MREVSQSSETVDRDPDRRSALRVVGTVAVTGLGSFAGCAGTGDSDTGGDDSTPTDGPSSTATVTVTESGAGTVTSTPREASVSATDAELVTESVVAGESFTVRVTAANDGEVAGELRLRLQRDGEPVVVESFTVDPTTEETVTIDRSITTPGEYTVGVDGRQVGTLTVTPRSDIYVAPDGYDTGAGSETDPLARIQTALDRARPGATVHVAAGEYAEPIETVRSGTPTAPITVTGPTDAVLRSSDRWYNPVEIRHSHFEIRGLTISGLEAPDAPETPEAYSEAQLIQARPQTDTDAYLEGLVISPNRIGGSQKSLVSVERTVDSEVGGFEVVGPAGADYLFGDTPGHNGEIVYVGTSPKNLGTDWHPWESFDETSVRVHHVDASAGYGHAELVDLKPGTHDCTVEYCTSAGGGVTTDETTPTALSHNGRDNVVRWNVIRECPIAVEFDADYSEWTHDNDLYGNRFENVDEAIALEDPDRVSLADQGSVCNNTVDGERRGSRCETGVPRSDGAGHDAG